VKKAVPATLAIVGAAILQATLAPYLAIGGVEPNFLLLAVVTLALTEGPVVGASAGFAAGLIFDLLGTGPVGAMALVLTVTGYLAGALQANLFAEGWRLPLSVLAAASLLSGVAYALVLQVLGEGGSFWSGVVTVVLPAALYNTALALLIYPWLARFLRREQPMRQFRRLA
jgi:rod shape-determining protein MreD